MESGGEEVGAKEEEEEDEGIKRAKNPTIPLRILNKDIFSSFVSFRFKHKFVDLLVVSFTKESRGKMNEEGVYELGT